VHQYLLRELCGEGFSQAGCDKETGISVVGLCRDCGAGD
jgi:hypothetical protein